MAHPDLALLDRLFVRIVQIRSNRATFLYLEISSRLEISRYIVLVV